MSDPAPQTDTRTAPAPDPPESPLPRWLVPAGFIVGCVFLLLPLAIELVIRPDEDQHNEMMPTLGTLRALGGAAFSMSLSGFLSLRLNLPSKGYIVTGGTLAVFVILYGFAPGTVIGCRNIIVNGNEGPVHIEQGARTTTKGSCGFSP
ncbi:hypothetical protein WME90_45295 [Sorangium sp. So ce375]|uniref:hypothetical protein n=1 Tax=Sorangium sp. So ce375 TaxID=3133306 RepID=UPI003F5AEBE7